MRESKLPIRISFKLFLIKLSSISSKNKGCSCLKSAVPIYKTVFAEYLHCLIEKRDLLVHRTLGDQAKVGYACKEPKIHAMDLQRLHQSLPQNGPQHHVEVNRSLGGRVLPKINLDLFEQLHVLIFYLFFCIQEKHRFSLVIFGFL